MSDAARPAQGEARDGAPDTQPLGLDTAGSLLRTARQAQGMHLAALAMILKITPKKLQALEDDRYDELQGATFTRALAQAACRALKIDPAPVLARLPRAEAGSLAQAGGGLNAPFRERASRSDLGEALRASRGVLVAVAVLLAGAAALWLAPPGFGLSALSEIEWPSWARSTAPVAEETAAGPGAEASPGYVPAPGASAASAALPAALDPAAAAQAVAAAASAAEEAAASTTIPVQLRAIESSWVEVKDATGEALIARTLQAGEAVGFNGVLPVRVKIGNAAGTELLFRGQPVDLAPLTRDNVARVELK